MSRVWSRTLVSVAVLSVALVAAVVAATTVGPEPIPPRAVLYAVLNAVRVPVGVETVGGGGLTVPAMRFEWTRPFALPVDETAATIVVAVRLPRVVLAVLVGTALSAAGTVMQGFFRNPMADPSIVGVSAGAAVGAVAAIVVPLHAAWLVAALPNVGAGVGLQLAAFVGGLIAAFAVYLIATRDGRTPVATLLLVGVAVQTLLSAVVSFLLLFSGESMRQVVFWLMGNLRATSWTEVTAAAVVVPPLVVGLAAYARDLNALLLGEADAGALGVEVERSKRALLAVSAVLTGAAVSVSGVIGFVGLIVPHGVRLVVGPDHRILLPTAALGGGLFLLVADTLARAGAVELPVGIVTAAAGAPFFLYLLRTREVYEL
ncbi:MAG: vitamin B12 ABC transporter permease BtuC [Halobaculum sp.]